MTLLSGSLRDSHLLPMHVVCLHTWCVFKLRGVGASVRSAAPPMSKLLWGVSDWECPCPLLQPKSCGVRAGCLGTGCWYQLGAAGPHAGALEGEQQQRNRGTLQQCPALIPGGKQRQENIYFRFKVGAARLFLQVTQLCVCHGDECSARSHGCTAREVPRGSF